MADKVIFYLPEIYPCTIGGLEVYYYHLIHSLRNEFPDRQFILLTGCKSYIENYPHAIEIKPRLFILRRFGLGIFSSLLFLITSKKIVPKSIQCLVVPYTSDFGYNAIPFLVFRFLFKIPYVVHIHGGGMKAWRRGALHKLFFKMANNIAGVSKTIMDEYEQRTGRTIQLIPPLIPFNDPALDKRSMKREMNLESYKIIILYVGTLKSTKNPEILLNAYVGLKKKFIELHRVALIMVGDGPMRNELNRFIKDNYIDKYVHLVGRIPNEKVWKYYSVADIFVIPSEYEGTPIALLEALHNGLLCIGAKVNGIKDLINDNINGVLFELNNAEILSDFLKKYILNMDLADGMRSNAFKYSRSNYNYKEHLYRFMKYLDSSELTSQ
jgi:glycosyltransferase involved in cell wall biosynthesis